MQILNFVFILIGVLALFGAAAWLFQRFAGNRLGANTNRGRMPRLAVIDAAAVDGRRRLVLVRRDNVEHLLMIGGPTDIVVEPNIVRATPARGEQMAPRPVGNAEPPPRIAPLPDSNWNDGDGRPTVDAFDHGEPQMPEPPPRQARPSFADEMRRPAPPPPPSERRSDPLAGFAPEPIASRNEPRVELRNEPMSPPPARPQRAEPMMPRAARQPEAPKAPPPIRAERPVAIVAAAGSSGAAARAIRRAVAVERRSKPRRDGAAAGSSPSPSGRCARTARRRAPGCARAAAEPPCPACRTGRAAGRSELPQDGL